MKLNKYAINGMFAATLLAFCAIPGTSFAENGGKDSQVQKAAEKLKVIIQVSDNDPKKWALALNNAANVQEDVGKAAVDIEIVAYGPGLSMLKLDSEVGDRVAEAVENGVRVVACENTMHKQKLSREDMLPKLGYVKAGVVELATKQSQGYAYIRP